MKNETYIYVLCWRIQRCWMFNGSILQHSWLTYKEETWAGLFSNKPGIVCLFTKDLLILMLNVPGQRWIHSHGVLEPCWPQWILRALLCPWRWRAQRRDHHPSIERERERERICVAKLRSRPTDGAQTDAAWCTLLAGLGSCVFPIQEPFCRFFTDFNRHCWPKMPFEVFHSALRVWRWFQTD